MNYGPLKPPSAQALKVFAKVLENNPDADMRAIPNEWLLKERGISAEFSERISTLESKLETVSKEVEGMEALLDQWHNEVLGWRTRAEAAESRLGTIRNLCESWGANSGGDVLQRVLNQIEVVAWGAKSMPPDHQPQDVYGDCRCAVCVPVVERHEHTHDFGTLDYCRHCGERKGFE